MSTNQRYLFPASARLKSRKTIDTLFSKGKSFSLFPFRVIWGLDLGEEKLQVGVAVSSKKIKKATDRNRIKRKMREAWRLQRHELEETIKESEPSLSVFIIYVGTEIPDYKDVHIQFGKILKRLIKICNEKNQAAT